MRHDKRRLSPIGLSLRAFYVAACIGALTWFWLSRSEAEATIAFGWLMMLGTMPVGFLGGWLVGSVFALVETAGNVQVLSLWLVCAVLGYLQWFVLVPWLWRNRDRNLGRSSRAA